MSSSDKIINRWGINTRRKNLNLVLRKKNNMKLNFRCLTLLGLNVVGFVLLLIYTNNVSEKGLYSGQSRNGQIVSAEHDNGNSQLDYLRNIPNQQYGRTFAKQDGGRNNPNEQYGMTFAQQDGGRNIPKEHYGRLFAKQDGGQNKPNEQYVGIFAKQDGRQINTEDGYASEYILQNIPNEMYNRTSKYDDESGHLEDGYSRNLQRILGKDLPRELYMKELWKAVDDMVNRKELFSKDFDVDIVLDGLRTARVLKVTTLTTHSALKWILDLEGGAKAVFKPFLIILGMRLAPYTVGRYLSLNTEVWPVADNETRNNIIKRGNRYCIRNKCWSCRGEGVIVCPKNNMIYGSVKYWLKGRIHNFHNAVNGRRVENIGLYRSAYVERPNGVWMVESNYCSQFRARPPYNELRVFLDVVDSQITDFIISNYDSRYTAILDGSHGNKDSYIFLSVRLDYGLAFCTRLYQPIHGTILSLYQCCQLRRSTYEKLQSLSVSGIKETLRRFTKSEIKPVLTEYELSHAERQIQIVLRIVSICAVYRGGLDNVLVTE